MRDSIELSVTDFRVSLPFYVVLAGGLGMQLVEASNDFRCWRCHHADLAIRRRASWETAASGAHRRTGPHPVRFDTAFPQVVDDVYHRLTRLRATIIAAPHVRLARTQRYALVFADPDGQSFELRYEPQPNQDAGHDASRAMAFPKQGTPER